MHVLVRFFAAHREATGQTAYGTDVPDGSRASDVLGILLERFPRLRPLTGGTAFAINQTVVPAETKLREGDELALLPPMAGG